MKHIKIFEDFRIIEKAPKWFYLVLRFEKAWESLLKMEFNGVVGISDNPKIINSWFDVRDTLLIMDGEELLKLNPHIHKIDYKNPNQLVSNNFYLVNRLLQNKDLYIYDVCQKIFSNSVRVKHKNAESHNMAHFLNENIYRLDDYVENYINDGKVIKNLWDFTNIIWDALPEVIVYYNKNYSFRSLTKLEDLGDKNVLYFVLQEGILELVKSFEKEGEWIIKKDKISNDRILNIPLKSKLYFKIDVTDEAELKRMIDVHKYSSYKGMKEENIKFITDLINDYNLDKKYDIQFIQGHMKTYDIWKDEPIPNTITYSQLMKSHKGFPKKKK